MNQDKVKELLLKIEDSELEFSVIFTGKASKKVNGLYKSDTHEILLHNKNFSVDNELLYTAIHEYTHHRLFELDGTRAGRVHTQRFWSYFHRLLQKAEEQGVYKITLEESPELLELTDTIRTTIMAEDGKLMKELGRLLGKARQLCKQAGVRYEDYIDRVLCLPRASAATMEKMHVFDVKPELGYEAMKVVANIVNPDKRTAAEELFLHKNSPAFVRDSIKTKPQDEDPRRKLENEKRRIERTIASLQSRLSQLEDTLAKLPVTAMILCLTLLLHPWYPLAAEDSGGTLIQTPDIPAIPDVSIGGNTLQRPVPPVIRPPAFQQSGKPRATATEKSAPRSTASGKTDLQQSKLLNGLNAQTLAALTQNSSNATVLNTLLGGLTDGQGFSGSSVAALQTDTNGAVLAKILTELEKLQAQTVRTTPEAASEQSTPAKQEAAAGPTTQSGGMAGNAAAELIRLRINGRELKNDLIYTFCSRPCLNGSFLYGADRRFTVNGSELNETAYFLCRKTEPHRYEISIDIRQEPLNTNSYFYKLYELSPVSVTQTSDLIFWHYKAPDLEAELVFRVAEAEK